MREGLFRCICFR